MLISSGVSTTCLFAPAPYYKLNKGFSSAFCLNQRFKLESLGKVSFIYYIKTVQVYCMLTSGQWRRAGEI